MIVWTWLVESRLGRWIAGALVALAIFWRIYASIRQSGRNDVELETRRRIDEQRKVRDEEDNRARADPGSADKLRDHWSRD